jgi:hypothetical protein
MVSTFLIIRASDIGSPTAQIIVTRNREILSAESVSGGSRSHRARTADLNRRFKPAAGA